MTRVWKSVYGNPISAALWTSKTLGTPPEYAKSGSPTEFCSTACLPSLLRILWLCLGVVLRRTAGRKALFEVVDDVVNVLDSDGDANHVFCHSRVETLLFRQLLVCR
jgi:hypothetical protein